MILSNFYIYLFINIATFMLLISTCFNKDVSTELHEELNRKVKNSICCFKKMKCCKKPSCPPSISIRSVLVRCPNTACEASVLTRSMNEPISNFREQDIKHFQGFDEDEPLIQSEVTNCYKKLLITMKIINNGVTNCKSEFVVIDHVYDPISQRKARLLNPYVIKIKQEPIAQMYGLKFLHVVNSEAKEVVYNKHNSNYRGCCASSGKSICGSVKYHGQLIPYSQGFCCSCDALKNAKRQPPSNEDTISYSDPAFLLDGIKCSRKLKGNTRETDSQEQGDLKTDIKKSTNLKRHDQNNVQEISEEPDNINIFKEKVFSNIPALNFPNNSQFNTPTTVSRIPQTFFNIESNDDLQFNDELLNNQKNIRPFKKQEIDDEIINPEKIIKNDIKVDNKKPKLIQKRQVQSSGLQRRGGQNCADRYTPAHLDPDTYHESTHCLKFSDLWYTVYQLKEPIIEHSAYLQIFEKRENAEGCTQWRDLTKGKMIRMGALKSCYKDEKSTLAIKYKTKECEPKPGEIYLNYKNARLLIPEGIGKSDMKKYPELQGGPGEYLVVSPNQISLDGDQCNRPGVGFEAFFKQPNRCSVPKGTCLANQPKHLWEHDHEAEKHGKKGCFFLKYYGNLPDEPIRKNCSRNEQFLAMQYTGKHESVIDFEMKADLNTILRPQSSAKITEVYIDSTNPTKTMITIKVTNSGLISSSFSVRLSDCPLEMPAAFNHISSKPVLIPPQNQHIFYLEIKCSLPADRFHCSVEVLNCKLELVALRRIRLQKLDRCICTWHCLCACVGSLEGLKCIPMSLEHYHAAGFQGSLPITTYVANCTFLDDVMSIIMYFTFFLFLTLLSMGLTKACVGQCCCPLAGGWGLNILLDLPKKMPKYYEEDLTDRQVIYDEEGWPIHPDTKQKVRNISRTTEFCMNLLFFFTYPSAVLILLIKRICCPYYTYDNDDRDHSCCFEEVHNFSITQCGKPSITYTNRVSDKEHNFPQSDHTCSCLEEELSENNEEDEDLSRQVKIAKPT